MATAPIPAPIDYSSVSQALERARTVLQQRHNETLARKAFVVQGYVQLIKIHPERDYREALTRALADLTSLLPS